MTAARCDSWSAPASHGGMNPLMMVDQNQSDSMQTPDSYRPATRLDTVDFPAPGGPVTMSTGCVGTNTTVQRRAATDAFWS